MDNRGRYKYSKYLRLYINFMDFDIDFAANWSEHLMWFITESVTLHDIYKKNRRSKGKRR